MKKNTLKARGARYTDEQWAKIERIAKANGCYPSDVLRALADKAPENLKLA